MTNEWTKPEHAEAYLARMETVPHRMEGESTLLAEIPVDSKRVLDLGCGNGHLLNLVLAHCPAATGVGLDFSPTMLREARARFSDNDRVSIFEHNLDEALPQLGTFDCVVSSFAIHHCSDARKRQLYAEVFELLSEEGVFCNLEHVASPTETLHTRFLAEMDITPADEDPSNKLLDVETQLRWLRELGFSEVDCHWKWRELAMLGGSKPRSGSQTEALAIDDSPTQAEVRWLGEQLEAYNVAQVGRNDSRPLNLVIREHGNVIAGLKAVTGWDWLYIEVLWVHAKHRGHGFGRKLLETAEREAQRRGCIGSCLSTFNFQAPDFYAQRGFSQFGHIDNYPDRCTMYFVSKKYGDAG